MTMISGTKYLFAQTLRQLLRSKRLHQVKITELCQACGAERQTFYYHFRDKYDLAAWIYEQTFQQILHGSDGVFRLEEMEKLLLALREDRMFYKKLFEDHSQNALLQYIQQVNISYTRQILLQEMGGEELSDETEFAMRFFSHAWMGCIRDWICRDPAVDAKQYAKWIYENTSDRILRDPAEI